MKKCVYCGKEAKKITSDHIPPKGLFAKPYEGLITVPCCHACNSRSYKDDEYLRTVIAMNQEVSENPDIARLWPQVKKGLTRPQSKKFFNSILRCMELIPVHTTSGRIVGHLLSIDVDLPRLNSVIERTMRGLYFHHRGRILSTSVETHAYALDSFQEQVQLAEVKEVIVRLQHTTKVHAINRGAFVYHIHFPAPGVDNGVFACSIYGKIHFIGFFKQIVSPKKEGKEEKSVGEV